MEEMGEYEFTYHEYYIVTFKREVDGETEILYVEDPNETFKDGFYQKEVDTITYYKVNQQIGCVTECQDFSDLPVKGGECVAQVFEINDLKNPLVQPFFTEEAKNDYITEGDDYEDESY